MNFNQKKVKEGAVTVGGMIAGAVVSRVGAGVIPLKNDKMKHGILTVLPLLAAGLVKNKTLQNVALGASVTQAGYLIKSFVEKTENKTIKQAFGMGCPMENEPIIIYANEDLSALNAPSVEDYEFLKEEQEFLGNPNAEIAEFSAV